MEHMNEVLNMIEDQGYQVIIKEEQSNGVWYRLKRWHSDITISL